jgi:hypothetical protein
LSAIHKYRSQNTWLILKTTGKTMPKCNRGCGKSIILVKEAGSDKWRPYNIGTWELHTCQESKEHQQKRLTKEIDKKARFGLYDPPETA